MEKSFTETNECEGKAENALYAFLTSTEGVVGLRRGVNERAQQIYISHPQFWVLLSERIEMITC